MLNFPALLSFADRKKIRETNPNEEKFSEAGGGRESPLQPPGINPIINSTSSSNMALISNALAAYTYISGRATFIKSCMTSPELPKDSGFLSLTFFSKRRNSNTRIQGHSRPGLHIRGLYQLKITSLRVI